MPFAPIERLRTQWQELPQESRFAIGILSIVGIGVLGFSAAYLRLRITGPFFVPLSAVKQSTQQYNDLMAQNNQDLELRKKDTDRDGLNDYSELKVYKTSPYLADSDSDGLTDALEIAQGQDPNCPKGQQCIQGLNANRTTTSTNGDLLTESTNPVEQFIASAPDPKTLTAAQKREYLKQTGYVTDDELNGLPDGQIDEVYQAAYDEVLSIRQKLQQEASTTTGSTPSSTQATTTTP